MFVAVEERERRERLRDLAVFERLNGNPAKTSPSLAVKKVLKVEIPHLFKWNVFII